MGLGRVVDRAGDWSHAEWGRTRSVRGRGDRRSPVSAGHSLIESEQPLHIGIRHGRGPTRWRISIVGTDGIRRTLLDGLPSASNDVNDPSGPAGLVMRAMRYTSRSASATPSAARQRLARRDGRESEPRLRIFSSVLAIHFSASVERTTAGFSLTAVDYDALADGQTVKLSNGSSDEITIELVANFPDYVPNPLPTVPNSVRGSNPFDLELIGDQLYVTDGGRNVVWQADIHTGAFAPLAAFDPCPTSPASVDPFSRPCRPGFRSSKGGCSSRCSADSRFHQRLRRRADRPRYWRARARSGRFAKRHRRVG